MKTKTTNIVFGILLVIIGIGYVGNIFEVWSFKLFFPGWWTMLIILPALVKLLQNGPRPLWLALMTIGVLLLLRSWGLIPDVICKLIAPLCTIGLGLSIIFRGKLVGSHGVNGTPVGSPKCHLAFFGGSTPSYSGKLFPGAFATAILGGVTLKLREAQIADGAVIDALAVFGGVDVLVPTDVNVEVSGLPVFGGIGEPKNRSFDPELPTLHVHAVAIFGGVDVK